MQNHQPLSNCTHTEFAVTHFAYNYGSKGEGACLPEQVECRRPPQPQFRETRSAGGRGTIFQTHGRR
eukprot:COSAG03_NODE_20318_length_321_cov_0.698198_1_plen_66_part_01